MQFTTERLRQTDTRVETEASKEHMADLLEDGLFCGELSHMQMPACIQSLPPPGLHSSGMAECVFTWTLQD